jgi:hypothetical protein
MIPLDMHQPRRISSLLYAADVECVTPKVNLAAHAIRRIPASSLRTLR